MPKTIQDYKNDYAAAQAKGDKAGMAAANNGANSLRQQQGQAVQVADVTKEVYGNDYVGASKPASSGSASGINTWTDDQQAIKDKINANSQAWHTATTQEEKDRLHAENQQLASQLGGNVSFDSSTGTWSGSAYDQSKEPFQDLSDYINQMYSEQKKAAIAAINNAYQQNMASIDSAKEQISPKYQTARNQTAGTAEQAARNFAEYAAAYGLGSGASAQADLARNITLQNNMNQLNSEEADAYAQLELQKAQAEIDYNNAIAEAEANNNSQLAAALYQEKVRVQNGLVQQQQTLFEQALAEKQFQFQQQQADVSNNQWKQQFDYQKQQDQKAEEEQNRAYLAAWVEPMLENGFIPTAEILEAIGFTSDQAQAYIDYYKQMAAASSSKSSSGSKSSSSSKKSSSSSDSNNQPPAPEPKDDTIKNPSYSVDMNSVIQLGYGPISSDSLADLEAQGKIQSYTDGNLIKFNKTPTTAKTNTQSKSNLFLPNLGLLGG